MGGARVKLWLSCFIRSAASQTCFLAIQVYPHHVRLRPWTSPEASRRPSLVPPLSSKFATLANVANPFCLSTACTPSPVMISSHVFQDPQYRPRAHLCPNADLPANSAWCFLDTWLIFFTFYSSTVFFFGPFFVLYSISCLFFSFFFSLFLYASLFF